MSFRCLRSLKFSVSSAVRTSSSFVFGSRSAGFRPRPRARLEAVSATEDSTARWSCSPSARATVELATFLASSFLFFLCLILFFLFLSSALVATSPPAIQFTIHPNHPGLHCSTRYTKAVESRPGRPGSGLMMV